MRFAVTLASGLLVSLLTASSASAVMIAWTPIGNPGNPADTEVMFPDDTTGYGSVPYAYSIGTYEVTNSQYVEFLNAKAASDSIGLYNTNMGSGTGGITRAGSPGSYTYTSIAGREDMPVGSVSIYDMLRFANWMNNGQGVGSTETGAYTLLGGTATPSNGTTVTRNSDATIFLPSEDEWYKAAYYDAVSMSYLDYPAGSDTQTTCAMPSATPNQASCLPEPGGGTSPLLTNVGSYTGSASPYGTFDQGGNIWEKNETIMVIPQNSALFRGVRGGGFTYYAVALAASRRGGTNPHDETFDMGFRVASCGPGGCMVIPEPSTSLLVLAGLLGFAGWRRVHD